MKELLVVTNYDSLPEKHLLVLKSNSVFASRSYLDRCVKGEKCYIYNDDYIIIVQIKRKFIFRYGCVLSEIISLHADNNREFAYDFLNRVCRKIEAQYKIQWISSVLPRNLSVAYPSGAMVIPFGSYVVDLNLSLDDLWKNIHSKHRNSIRRAEKSSLVVKYGVELLEDFVLLDDITWKRSNQVGKGKEYYINLLSSMPSNSLLAVVYKDGMAHGGGLFLYNEYSCYYLYGATSNSPESGAMNYLHWEVIKKMKELGVKQYDFVGCRINEDSNSKYHGIQNFKKRFGGTLKRGFLYRKVNNKFYYFLYATLLSLKQKRMYKDIIAQEYYKWENEAYNV